MSFLREVALHGLPPLTNIICAEAATPVSYLFRAASGRIAMDAADHMSDDDPGRGELEDFASDAEEWLLAQFDALTKR
jgi:hypothetical protein